MVSVTSPETTVAAPGPLVQAAATEAESAAPPAAAGPRVSSPDAPVRVEVPMPRALFDRLTEHDDAPRCRYDERFKMGEFVAEPGISHEGLADESRFLFGRITDALADAGHLVSWRGTGALRLLSDDGPFEPDASFYLDPAAVRDLHPVEEYLDVRPGLPPPHRRGRETSPRSACSPASDRRRWSSSAVGRGAWAGVRDSWEFCGEFRRPSETRGTDPRRRLPACLDVFGP